MACPNCVRRLKEVMEHKGWEKDGLYYRSPKGKFVHEQLVANFPSAVLADNPELIPEAAKVILGEATKAVVRRLKGSVRTVGGGPDG